MFAILSEHHLFFKAIRVRCFGLVDIAKGNKRKGLVFGLGSAETNRECLPKVAVLDQYNFNRHVE